MLGRIIQLYSSQYSKKHQIVHVPWVKFIPGGFYFTKVNKSNYNIILRGGSEDPPVGWGGPRARAPRLGILPVARLKYVARF